MEHLLLQIPVIDIAVDRFALLLIAGGVAAAASTIPNWSRTAGTTIPGRSSRKPYGTMRSRSCAT